MKHLIDITDLNVEEIDELIETAKDIIANKEKYYDKIEWSHICLYIFFLYDISSCKKYINYNLVI